MAHTPIQFWVHPVTGDKSISGKAHGSSEIRIVKEKDMDFFTINENTSDALHTDAVFIASFFFETNSSFGVECTEAEVAKIRGFISGKEVQVDANGAIIQAEGETPVAETTPELQLVQDPVIYERPETGLSQKNIPFFKFHNPNGKSAITISMTDVDHTRFDSLNDDTHQYVVVTKARIEIRCVCTVNEQLGLEFRFRGTTHVISAEESNNVRRITESRANPE